MHLIPNICTRKTGIWQTYKVHAENLAWWKAGGYASDLVEMEKIIINHLVEDILAKIKWRNTLTSSSYKGKHENILHSLENV